MSFRVETAPHQYTDYQILSATRLNNFGKQFLSLINPNYGTVPNENKAPPKETKSPTNENENENAPKESQTPTDENQAATTNGHEKLTEPVSPHVILHPSDLCRPAAKQCSYYIVSQDVIKQIEDHFLPHQSTLPYMAPSITTGENDEQLTTSILDWSGPKQSIDSTRKFLSQIVTIFQCRSTLSINSATSLSQRTSRRAVRLFINAQKQQQHHMDTFLDVVNEALLLETNTIKTLWDANGEQVTNPTDLLCRGRLYFASRDATITLDEMSISESDLASINRLELVREHLSQPACFVERPKTSEQINIPSRKSTPFDIEERRSATVQAQAMAYNDPQTFPDVFLRHYEVGDVLGDGRFSAVFECRDRATGIQLALKIIDKTRCKGYEYLVENELSILRRVKHPNIIKLVEEFQNELKYFLVFEYVSNGDLLTAVTTMNKYSEHDVALMLTQLASALKYLHSLQIVHRDVKLENILMTNYPDQSVSLKLADFGLALCLIDPSPIVAAHGDNLCGTPMYMAPEVIQKREYRVENDMWSLGIITFTLLSGRAPFRGDNDAEILANVINTTIDFGVLSKTSNECREALSMMLEREPSRRISAGELLQHPWIKRVTQKQMEPINEGSSPRRKKGTVQKQPMLTFSSVEHAHSTQGSTVGGLLNDIDEF